MSEETQHTTEEQDIEAQFPVVPETPGLPEVPRIEVKLPLHPDKPQPGVIQMGTLSKAGVALSAVSSFVLPIVFLAVTGFYLDKKLHTGSIIVFAGIILGFILGLVSLINVIRKLAGES